MGEPPKAEVPESLALPGSVPLCPETQESLFSPSPPISERNEYENDKIHMSTMTLLMVTVIVFSAITGLLMGYDLCVVAVVLEPIENEFNLCPAQSIHTSAHLDGLNSTRRAPDVLHELTFPSSSSSWLSEDDQSKSQRSLTPSPCQMNAHRNHPTGRRVLRDENDAFQSCGPKQMFVAIVSPGAAIGSFFAGFISDWIGRRPTLGLSDFLIMLGTFLMGFGSSFAVLLTGRFFLGLGIGTGFVIFSTYVSEISPDHRRGQLVSCQEVAQCVGCLAAYGIAASNGVGCSLRQESLQLSKSLVSQFYLSLPVGI